jgi:starch phosphorylase
VNLAVLVGWWDEGWNEAIGWAFGGREQLADEAAQDWNDAQDLYRILEDEVVPAYYDREGAKPPARWLEKMRTSISSTIWQFSTTRMLHEYAERLYLPAAGIEVKAEAGAQVSS